MHHHTHHRNWFFSFVVIILAFTLATPVLAEYLGPNRTVTETYNVCQVVLNECKYVEEKGEWKYKTENTWSCSLESKPWQAYSNESRPCNDTLHTPGYQYWSRQDVPKTELVTYPPATISSSLQNCTLQNGWCTTAPQLSLSGSEPVAGHSIIAIEGTRNGQSFACTGSTCSVPLGQGNNNFTYWALSSFLDSSEMGSFTAKVDSQAPTITGSFTGTLGLNGWYLGSVTLNSVAYDSASGLASVLCTRDGVQVTPCGVITLNSDGPHTIVISARDNVGHVRTITQNASIDTRDPVLTASISGAQGANTWYTAADLNASATDPIPGSGLSTFQYNADGNGWTTFPVSGTLPLADGKHTVDLRAVDKSGRTVTSSKSYWLDTAPPDINTDSSGTFGLNDWYITSPTLTASASDDTSGLDLFEYSLNHGPWTAYTASLSLSDGVHTVSFWAQDQAGLVAQVDRTYQVDTRPPQIAGSLSGIPGANNWYISEATLTVSASDPAPGSGVDSFTYTLDGAPEASYTTPLILSDGQHTVQLTAQDKAGHPYSIEQTVSVDTIPPSLALGTTLPAWVRDTVTLNGTAGDGGSGLSTVEISLDGGQTWQAITGTDAWNYTWNTSAGTNGIQQIHLRAADQAGLATQQTINAGVDNHPPEISLPDSWLQWDTVTLNVLDEHSGLSEARVEISDPKGRWPTRVISLDPGQFPLQFKWDRRFGDGTIAEAGTYDVKVFALDRLSHNSEKNASIHVLIDILPPGPTSTTQPYTPTAGVHTSTPVLSPTATPIHGATQVSSPTAPVNITRPSPTATQSIAVRMFGTIEPPVQGTATAVVTSTPRATPTRSNAVEWLESIILPGNSEESVTQFGSPEEPAPPAPNRSVLWGTAAAAAIGAATAYVQEEKRKREEEKARLQALEEAKEERRENRKEQKMAKMDAKRAQEAAWEEARQEQLDGSSLHTDLKVARLEAEEGVLHSLKKAPPVTTPQRPTTSIYDRRAEAKDETIQEKEKTFYTTKPQDWKADFDEYMAQRALLKKAEEKPAESEPKKKKSWWDKTMDYVDEHQVQIALGVGILAGVVAVVLTGGLALPALTVMAGAAVAAGTIVAAGTVVVNSHFDRPWHENLLRNVALAGGAAALTAGAGIAFKAATSGISAYCAVHQSTCARVEPVFKVVDAVEENWLKAKLTYQTWRGDQSGAAETAFELHSEYADGGMPGNAVAKELRHQFNDLSQNAVPIIQEYGADVLPLLVKHGDEGLKLIQKFGTDGISWLKKYGNDATDLILLDDDVLDYVIQQGPDAVEALSRWSAKDLLEYGPELALRAKKDAKVLADIKKLTSSGPVDPKSLTKEQKALIEAIAANSTQYADEGQVVLGKWVDFGSGFVQTAQDTGSVHYNPHPDMWTMLGGLGKAKQEEVAWLINKQVVQKGIDKGLPFEYTLNGIPNKNIVDEGNAVEAIFAGATDAEIMDILQSKSMPIRMKELKELQKAGYQYGFDESTNSYILTLP